MHPTMHWFWLAIAGALGVLSRAGVASVAGRLAGDGFPWGVTFVNITGSFAFAAIVAATPVRFLPTGFEKILLVGFLGGFTTFSSFSYDTIRLLQAGNTSTALLFVAVNNVGGFAAVWAGLWAFACRSP